MKIQSVTCARCEKDGQLVCDIVSVKFTPDERYFQIDFKQIWQCLDEARFELYYGWNGAHLADVVMSSAKRGAQSPEALIRYDDWLATVRIVSGTVSAPLQEGQLVWGVVDGVITGPCSDNRTSEGDVILPEFQVAIPIPSGMRRDLRFVRQQHLLTAKVASILWQRM